MCVCAEHILFVLSIYRKCNLPLPEVHNFPELQHIFESSCISTIFLQISDLSGDHLTAFRDVQEEIHGAHWQLVWNFQKLSILKTFKLVIFYYTCIKLETATLFFMKQFLRNCRQRLLKNQQAGQFNLNERLPLVA